MNTRLKWTALAALSCLLFNPAIATEFVERSANNAPEGHRFLFVVETSSANRKLENGNRQAVFDLIVSGVSGQMRSGDTFGIWTFNDEVRAGEYPVTVWEEEHALDLAGHAAAFLQKQRYTKRSSPQVLVAELRRLSDRVGEFNVFVISTGQEAMTGTPFDANINAAYKALTKESTRSGKPMVTTFVVRKGRPIRSGVVLAGDRIVLPERPPSPPSNPPAAAPAAANPPAPVVAKSTTPPTTTPPPEPRKKVIQIITNTNAPATAAVRVTAAASSPTNAAQTNVVSEEPVAIASQLAVPVPTVPLATAPASSIVPTGLPSLPEAAAPIPEPPPRPVSQPEVATTAKVGKSPAPYVQSLAPPVTPAPPPAVSTQETPGQAPLVVQAREPSSAVPAVQTLATPVVQGAVMPGRSQDGLSAAALLAIGGTLFGAACFLFILLLRRAPAAGRGSLITQAMRPERKT